MSSMSLPVELPTARQSRNFHQIANIHDPNWIPILNNKAPSRSPSTTPYAEVVPQYPSRGGSRPATPKDGASSSQAGSIRGIPQELDAGPVLTYRPRQASLQPHNRHISRETEDTMTSSGDDTVQSADAPSTAGTGSLLESQTYALARGTGSKEARSFTQPAFMSDRASVISNSKRPIPTSKYSRKPAGTGSTPETPLTASPVTASPPMFPQTTSYSPKALTIDASQARTMSPPRLQSLGSPQLKQSSPIAQYSTSQTEDTQTSSATTTASQRSPTSPPPTIQELAGELPKWQHPPRLSSVAAELPSISRPAPPPPEPPNVDSSSSHKNRKSTASVRTTASVRKKRALHSHPSNPSIRSEKFETATSPTTPQSTTFPIQGSALSRTSGSRRPSIAETEPPSEAPSAPLPELPPKVAVKSPSMRQTRKKSSDGALSLFPQQPSHSRTPSTTQNTSKSEAMPYNSALSLHHSPSTFSIGGSTANTTISQVQHRPNKSEVNAIPHKELANFMASKSTLIFRRFDDMHVKLLLSIQDEISLLEQELLQLEAASQTSTNSGLDGHTSEDEYDEYNDDDHDGQGMYEEKESSAARRKSKRGRRGSTKSGNRETSELREVRREKRKVKIMAELRRLLAEYDHLFSNWTLMQKSVATVRDCRDLERYLSGDVGTSDTAREDLLWVERNASDLSCVSVGGNTVDVQPASHSSQRQRSSSMNTAKAAFASWGRSRAKSKSKGASSQGGHPALPLKFGGASVESANGTSADRGDFMREKSTADADNEDDTIDRRKPSILVSLFGGCAGRRK